MTITEQKAQIYDELLDLLKDRVALEEHFRAEGKSENAIQSVRADAYAAVVNLILGPNALPGIMLSYRA